MANHQFVAKHGPDQAGIPDRRRSIDRRGDRGRRRLRTLLAAGLVLGIAGSTGCTASRGLFGQVRRSHICDDIVTKYRNRVAAEKAWHCRKASFGAQANNEVFKAGFIDGYLDVAEGGDGCTPPFAPEEYWGWRYQSAGGRNAVGSWFAGFPLGVQAAEEDGLGTFRQLPFCNPGCGPNAAMIGGTGPGLVQPGIDPMMPGMPAPGMAMEFAAPTTGPTGGVPQTPGTDGFGEPTEPPTGDADPADLRNMLRRPISPGTPIDQDGDGIPDGVTRSPSVLNRTPRGDGGNRAAPGSPPAGMPDGPATQPDAGQNPFRDAPLPSQRSELTPEPINLALDATGENGAAEMTIEELFNLNDQSSASISFDDVGPPEKVEAADTRVAEPLPFSFE